MRESFCECDISSTHTRLHARFTIASAQSKTTSATSVIHGPLAEASVARLRAVQTGLGNCRSVTRTGTILPLDTFL